MVCGRSTAADDSKTLRETGTLNTTAIGGVASELLEESRLDSLTLLAMNTAEVLSAIDEEITRLEQARALLGGVVNASAPSVVEGKRRGRPPGATKQVPVAKNKTRTVSAEARARIAAAQKARWAAKKKAEKKAATAPAAAPAPKKAVAPAKKSVVKKAVIKKAPVTAKRVAVKKAAMPAKKVTAKKAASQTKGVASASKKSAPKVRAAAVETPQPSPTAEKATGSASTAENTSSE